MFVVVSVKISRRYSFWSFCLGWAENFSIKVREMEAKRDRVEEKVAYNAGRKKEKNKVCVKKERKRGERKKKGRERKNE